MKVIHFTFTFTGEENSSVQGVILSSGLFDGSIRIGDEELYVEPAQNYFSTSPDFHSVIYRLVDVHYPETNRTCIDAPRVPASKLRHKKNHSKKNHSWERLYQEDMASSDRSQIYYWRDLDSLHYTESGSSSSEPYGVRSVQRTQWPEDGGSSRRGSVAVDRRKSTCLLYLQADHLFYRRLGGEEACIDAMTRHVQRVNSIYRNTGKTFVLKLCCLHSRILIAKNHSQK